MRKFHDLRSALPRSQYKHRSFRVFQKFRNSNRLSANQPLGNRCRVITPAKPNHFGRDPKRRSQFIKVRIRGDNGKAVAPGVFPNSGVCA
jgi:hypothetical protein